MKETQVWANWLYWWSPRYLEPLFFDGILSGTEKWRSASHIGPGSSLGTGFAELQNGDCKTLIMPGSEYELLFLRSWKKAMKPSLSPKNIDQPSSTKNPGVLATLGQQICKISLESLVLPDRTEAIKDLLRSRQKLRLQLEWLPGQRWDNLRINKNSNYNRLKHSKCG